MSHPFGDLLSQHLHRKHGLSQSKLAEGILQDPSIIAKMCKGKRLSGSQARGRVLDVIRWLHAQAVLETVAEANALLYAAGMASLGSDPAEAELLHRLRTQNVSSVAASTLPAQRTNLPALLTSFVGRAHELTEITHLVADHRLMTLTGAGGVGKTRLAIEIGIHLMQDNSATSFVDGVWLVELAALSQPALLVQEIARLFKLPEQANRAPLDVLQAYLAQRHLLLILDNCEHLVDACAEIVVGLLQHCWRLHILATSREELRVPGEVLYSVPPLALPEPRGGEPEYILDCASAQLLVERMRLAQPSLVIQPSDMVQIAQICRHLDGIPLALELAAPLTRSMTLTDIADQLHNQMAILVNSYRTVIPRHQTMHSALAWSYRLLASSEQQVLARLSVFAGGWTIDAAQAVCADTPAASLAGILQRLAGTSWLLNEDQDGQRRYRFLEPVRQFAQAQLTARGEQDDARRRHAVYFLALAEQAEAELHGPQQATWLDRLDQDLDNVRAALEWSLIGGNAEIGLLFAAELWQFWLMRGYFTEGRDWLARLLALPHDHDIQARVKALHGAGKLAAHQGDYEAARALLADSLALFRTLDDKPGMAWSLNELGAVAYDQGEFGQAQALWEESLALFRTRNDKRGMAEVLDNLGRVVRRLGDYARATVLFQESLKLSHEIGNRRAAAVALKSLGNMAWLQGDYEAARALLAQSLMLFRELNDNWGIALALNHLGLVAREQGEYETACSLFEEGLELRRELGDRRGIALLLYDLGTVAYQQGNQQRACALLTESLAVFRELGNLADIAVVLNYLGQVALARGDTRQAVSHFRESLTLLPEVRELLARGSRPRNVMLGSLAGIVHADLDLHTQRLVLHEVFANLARAAYADGHTERAVRLLSVAATQWTQATSSYWGAKGRAAHERLVSSVRAQLDVATFEREWAEGQAMTLEQAIAEALASQSQDS